MDGEVEQALHVWQCGEWVRSRRTGAIGRVVRVTVKEDGAVLRPPRLRVEREDGSAAEAPADAVELVGGGWRTGFGQPVSAPWGSVLAGRRKSREQGGQA